MSEKIPEPNSLDSMEGVPEESRDVPVSRVEEDGRDTESRGREIEDKEALQQVPQELGRGEAPTAKTPEELAKVVDAFEAEAIDVVLENPQSFLQRIESSGITAKDRTYLYKRAARQVELFVQRKENEIHAERVALKHAKEDLGQDTKDWRNADSATIGRIRQKMAHAGEVGQLFRSALEVPKPLPPEDSSEEMGEKNHSEWRRKEEILEGEKQLKGRIGDLAEPFSKLARILRQREEEDLNELFEKRAAGFISGAVRVFSELSNKQNITVADAEEVKEVVTGMIRLFDGVGGSGRRSMREDGENLSRLSFALREGDEAVRQLVSCLSKNEIESFEGVSPLLSGLLNRIENCDSAVNGRRIQLERYLDRR